MAQITLNIPDQHIERAKAGLCVVNGLEVTNANAKLALVNYIKQCAKEVETHTAVQTNQVAKDQADADLGTAVATIETDVDAINIT